MIVLQYEQLKEKPLEEIEQEKEQYTDDAPPQGSSQQWKALYGAIAAYAKGLKE